MFDRGLLAKNFCLPNLTSLKDNSDSFTKSQFWGVHFNKLFLTWLLVFELLPTESLWSFFISYLSNIDLSSRWGPKLSNALSSSPIISISYSDCMLIRKTYGRIWLVYAFIYLVSLFVDFILFLYLRHVYILVYNSIRILFRLRIKIILMRGQRELSNWDLQYHNINEGVKIIYNNCDNNNYYCLWLG